MALPENYPTGCTDAEIQQVLAALAKDITEAGETERFTIMGRQTVGLSELQRRSIEKLNQVTADALRASERNQRTAKRFALFATALTVASVVLAAAATYFAYETAMTDKAWQREETRLLQEIRDNTRNQPAQRRPSSRSLSMATPAQCVSSAPTFAARLGLVAAIDKNPSGPGSCSHARRADKERR